MTTAGVAQGMLAAALEAWDAGLAPIPVRMDFTKRPALEKWNGRTHERFARAEVERLFAEPRALAIVCGAASGGLEMLEVEGVAVEEGMWQRLFDSWPEELRQRVCGGYLEFSPSGGVHILYRVDGEVPGNTKLACRPRPDIAKAACDTLIETRGFGGYVVVAPSPGEAHESGQPWELHSGGFSTIATITAAEREVLVGAARVFDEMPPEPERPARAPATRTGKGTRPGEDFDARHVCGEVLERNGWAVVRRRGDEVMWCRPGKSVREGHSGIEHLDEPNRFVNWSSSVDLECERGYSPFALVAALEHGGDFAAAARELGKQGYGEQKPRAKVTAEMGTRAPDEAPDDPDAVLEVARAAVNPSPNGWKRLTASQLLTMEFDPIRWAVPGMLPEGLTVFGGRPKARKSWLMLQMAIARATGGVFLGERLEAAPVVYFALEDGPRRLADRLRALECPTDMEGLVFQCGMPPIGRGGVEYISELVEASGAGLVVVDTISRALDRGVGRGVDQDKNADMTATLNPLQRFALERGLALVVVDHLRKTGISTERNPVEEVMGSTAKVGVADTIWGLYRKKGEHRGQLSVIGRDVEERDLVVEFAPTPAAWQLVGDVEEVDRSESQRKYLGALRALGPSDAAKVGAYLLVSRESAAEMLRKLAEGGHIDAVAEVTGKRGRPRYMYSLKAPIGGGTWEGSWWEER